MKQEPVSCRQALEFVSALYDGETTPAGIVDHVDACLTCRQVLDEYARMGIELRLIAARWASEDNSLAANPAAITSKGRSKLDFLRGRILVPRIAFATVAALVLVLSAGLITLHGQQSQLLWFDYTLDANHAISSNAVKPGSHDFQVWGNSSNNVTAVRMLVETVKEDQVRLVIKARHYSEFPDASKASKDLDELQGHSYSFVPGGRLEIPVEGGTSMVMQGRVLDHRPKILPGGGGIPVEPAAGQLVVSSPALISGDKVLRYMKGATAFSSEEGGEILMYVPGTGLLRFALQPLPGWVKGTADYGVMEFALDGQRYSIFTASPISGGDQPSTIWVKNNSHFRPADDLLSKGFIGSDNQVNSKLDGEY